MTVPRIALFALTGFGNAVLRALCREGIPPRLIVTEREPGPFPHYPESDLWQDAAAAGIPCFFDETGHAEVRNAKPDLLFVATYRKIVSAPVRAAARCAFNFHPSLLPRYRGPNPFFWVLRNGEARTGLTVHALTDEIDGGDIYWQRAYDITAHEDQGTLRRALAHLAGEAACDIAWQAAAASLVGRPQNAAEASYFGRPTESDRAVDLTGTIEQVCRQARPAMPVPGALAAGRIFTGIVEAYGTPAPGQPGSILFEDDHVCRVRVADGVVTFTTRPTTPSTR
jgi:methionyl-tRNA formyltransferase